jgi:hypothetical protein
MPNIPSKQYLDGRLAQLQAACDAHDGRGAAAVIDQIRFDGYPEVADGLLRDLVEQGSRDLVAAAGAP